MNFPMYFWIFLTSVMINLSKLTQSSGNYSYFCLHFKFRMSLTHNPAFVLKYRSIFPLIIIIHLKYNKKKSILKKSLTSLSTELLLGLKIRRNIIFSLIFQWSGRIDEIKYYQKYDLRSYEKQFWNKEKKKITLV